MKLLLKTVLADLTSVTLTVDPKINRVPLLLRMVVWTKFEEGTSMHSRVIDRKLFLTHLTPMTLTFDLVTKSIRFLCCPGRMCGPSLGKVGQGVLELLIGNEKVTDGQTERPL